MRSEKSEISSTDHPRNFFHRAHNPYKVILFEEYSISTFQKHIVFLYTGVSGRSCDGVKMTIFKKVGALPEPGFERST